MDRMTSTFAGFAPVVLATAVVTAAVRSAGDARERRPLDRTGAPPR